MERASRFFKLLSLALFIMSACVCVCVVRVHADASPTYWVVPLNRNDGSIGTDYLYQSSGTGEGRAIVITNNSSTNIWVVSKQSDLKYNFKAGVNVRNNNGYSSANTINGVMYYFYLYNVANSPTLAHSAIDNGFPYVVTSDTSQSNLVYLTWGAGAVAPAEPINWGLVDLEGYQTNIAGQGQAAINNVDVISWNSATDTLGNDISDGNVRIRFVPGEYTADTKNNLLQRLYSDFVLDVLHSTDGGVFPVSNGSASFKWSDIIDTLNLPFASIYSLINENDAWFKRGWVYQIRLEIDDYEGEWQTVYASTSSGVENDLTIVNTTTVTQNTLIAIQNINSINETTNIWIVYETPVDPNPEYQPPEDDDEKPWWVYLLEMINNSIGVTNEYISEGTDESVQIVNNMNNEYNDLDTTVNEYDDIEGDLLVNLEDNLDDLDVDSDLISSNGFLNSARWISEQFTRLTTDNPIGSILKFSLVLGFVMIFLGRFR